MESKKVLILVIAFLCFNLAKAQEGWQLGFEINPNYYMMLNETDKNAKPNVLSVTVPDVLEAPRGWAFGTKAFYNFNDYIGLQTGLRYSWGRQDYTSGYGEVDLGATEEGSVTTELNYLQMPIMFSVSTNGGYSTKFYASIGVAPSYLIAYYEKVVYDLKDPFRETYYYFSVIDKGNDQIQYSYTQTGTEIEELTVERSYESKDAMYKQFGLFAVLEAGFLFDLNDEWAFNLGANSYVSLLQVDNIESYRWPESKFTRSRMGPNEVGETKYTRAKTTLMHIGVTFGLIYTFD